MTHDVKQLRQIIQQSGPVPTTDGNPFHLSPRKGDTESRRTTDLIENEYENIGPMEQTCKYCTEPEKTCFCAELCNKQQTTIKSPSPTPSEMKQKDQREVFNDLINVSNVHGNDKPSTPEKQSKIENEIGNLTESKSTIQKDNKNIMSKDNVQIIYRAKNCC